MKQLPKITIGTLDEEFLNREKERNIRKCQLLYVGFPIATKTWMALKTKMPMKFIRDNWESITNPGND